MESVIFLIAATLFTGVIWLAVFIWAARNRQFGDPKGNASRILRHDYDDAPKK